MSRDQAESLLRALASEFDDDPAVIFIVFGDIRAKSGIKSPRRSAAIVRRTFAEFDDASAPRLFRGLGRPKAMDRPLVI